MYSIDGIYPDGYFSPMAFPPDKLFAALAHSLRLRALILLHREGELCVCELTRALDAPQPTISKHLGNLRELGLVSDRREGQWIYYRLHPDLPQWVLGVIEAATNGLEGEARFAEDRAALGEMPERPGSRRCA